MKVLWFLIHLKFCIGSGDNLFLVAPRNNSHYKTDISKYIWLANDKMELTLVDLKEDLTKNVLEFRPGLWNKFFLFTSFNRAEGHRVPTGDLVALRNSAYMPQRPLVVLVHDWNSNSTSYCMKLVRDALTITNNNVITVDWEYVSRKKYAHAVWSVPEIGKNVGDFVEWILNEGGGTWKRTHFVGFGLGAHIVGNAGRALGGRPGRITGLDPSGPLFLNNNDGIQKHDGRYVEIFHTDFGYTGLSNIAGHVDFFPNGGKNQNICVGEKAHACSHIKACEYFAVTVRRYKLYGKKCEDLQKALSIACKGPAFQMGTNNLPKSGSGIYSGHVNFKIDL